MFRMKKARVESRLAVVVFFLLVLLDFCTKIFFKTLAVGYINTGVSFSAFAWVPSIVIILVELTICGVILVLIIKRVVTGISFYGAILILSGGFGNLISRVMWGGVWDWISPGFLPSFNFADIWINIGCFIFIIGLLYDRNK